MQTTRKADTVPTRALAAAATTTLVLALGAAGCSSSSSEPEKQVAELTMHPQLAQPGPDPASSADADSVMTATFEPARPGRSVELQRQEGDAWTTVSKGEQDRDGAVEFSAPYADDGTPVTYRVRAQESDGLPDVTSTAVETSEWAEPAFTDEFDGTELGPEWSDRLQGYSADSNRTCAKADPSAVNVADGLLHVGVLADPAREDSRCTVEGEDYAWRLNGHIGTQQKRRFTYGYAAARIKFQELRGQHGSFWLQAATREAEEGDADQTGAEIDVIEWFGEDDPKGGLASFIHHYPDNDAEGVTSVKVGGYLEDPDQYGDDWATEFHVFSVEWTPSEYVFRIDGQETFRTDEGVSGQPQFLVLSMLSSDYELPWLGGDENLPQYMDVDWVRYWELPE